MWGVWPVHGVPGAGWQRRLRCADFWAGTARQVDIFDLGSRVDGLLPRFPCAAAGRGCCLAGSFLPGSGTGLGGMRQKSFDPAVPCVRGLLCGLSVRWTVWHRASCRRPGVLCRMCRRYGSCWPTAHIANLLARGYAALKAAQYLQGNQVGTVSRMMKVRKLK